LQERRIAFHHGLPVPDRLEKLMGGSAGTDVTDPAPERFDEVLTPAALDFVVALPAMRRSGRAGNAAQRRHGRFGQTAEILDASIRGAPHRWNPEPRVPSHRGG
jgi:hypothetical protein